MLSTGFFALITNDQALMSLMAENWLYGVAVVALIVFCETGLVVLPFLPGDSLLFATGAFLGVSGILPVYALGLIMAAAIAGDFTNYLIGRSSLGRTILKSRWVRPRHIAATRRYFDRFGAFTITMGRFVPVVRTVAPFLAGLTGMPGARFAFYNVLGGVLWTALLILGGYGLGQIKWVQDHMSMMTLGIVVVSVLPVVIQLLRSRRGGEEQRG